MPVLPESISCACRRSIDKQISVLCTNNPIFLMWSSLWGRNLPFGRQKIRFISGQTEGRCCAEGKIFQAWWMFSLITTFCNLTMWLYSPRVMELTQLINDDLLTVLKRCSVTPQSHSATSLMISSLLTQLWNLHHCSNKINYFALCSFREFYIEAVLYEDVSKNTSNYMSFRWDLL